VDCLEKVFRIRLLGANAKEMAGTYPDAESQRLPTAVVYAAREVLRRNQEHLDRGRPPVVTAAFGADGITIHDPLGEGLARIYTAPVGPA
jgi:hypothetical protein